MIPVEIHRNSGHAKVYIKDIKKVCPKEWKRFHDVCEYYVVGGWKMVAFSICPQYEYDGPIEYRVDVSDDKIDSIIDEIEEVLKKLTDSFKEKTGQRIDICYDTNQAFFRGS